MSIEPTSSDNSTDSASPSPRPLNGTAGRLTSWFGGLLGRVGRRENGSLRTDIEDALAQDELSGAAFSPEERAMLRNILRFSGLRVEDVMVPRADIDALHSEMSLREVFSAFRASGHSRMPVYHDTLDDPIGMVHIRDVTAWISDRAGMSRKKMDDETAGAALGAVDLSLSLRDSGIIRAILFVPPSMPARALLEKMQVSRTQIALVIDEYGGTDGLVSLEDLVETIVGNIEDEHDTGEGAAEVKQVDSTSYIADARASLEDARRVIGQDFGRLGEQVDEDIDTIGGLVFTLAGQVPTRGELLSAPHGYEFEILDGDPRRIKQVRIRRRRKVRTPRNRSPARPDASPPSAT